MKVRLNNTEQNWNEVIAYHAHKGLAGLVGDLAEVEGPFLLVLARAARNHLEQNHAETPYIHLGAVLLSVDDLRGHVALGAGPCVGLGERLNGLEQDARYTEIAELDAAVAVEEEVRRLDIAVANL